MNKYQSKVLFLFPRLQHIIFILSFYLVLVLGTNLFRDGDPGRHITFGRYILSTMTLPQTDLFAFTTKNVPLPSYEWLAQIIFAIGYNLMGLNGVVLVVAFVLSTTFTLAYREMIRRQLPILVSFGFTIWIVVLTMIHWLARPHIFSLLFLIILVPRLARLAEGKKVLLWEFPLILLLWANTHAGFIFAFAIWFAFIAGNLWESLQNHSKLINPVFSKLLLTAFLSFGATLFNPSGWGLWKFMTSFVGNKYLIEIAGETRSVDFHTVSGWLVSMTLALIIIILSRSMQKRPTYESFLIAGWLMIGLYGIRNIPQFSIVTIPLVAEHAKSVLGIFPPLKRLESQIESIEAQLRGWVLPITVCTILTVLLALGVKLDSTKQGYHFNTVEYPVEAVNWIEKNPQQGHMFNYFAWGGYLIYRMWPNYEVFLDGQMIYIEPLVRDYEQILHSDAGWENKLDQYTIQWILVPPEERIAQTLYQDAKWEVMYKDQTAIIFRKR